MPVEVKEILRPGKYYTENSVLEVTRADLEHMCKIGNEMIQENLTVPVPLEHQDSAMPLSLSEKIASKVRHNSGWVQKYEMNGDSLVGYLDIQDEEVYPKLKTTIKFVSPQISAGFTDGRGKFWKNCITHIALTPRPRFIDQKPFGSPIGVSQALSHGNVLRMSMGDMDGGDQDGLSFTGGYLFDGSPVPVVTSLAHPHGDAAHTDSKLRYHGLMMMHHYDRANDIFKKLRMLKKMGSTHVPVYKIGSKGGKNDQDIHLARAHLLASAYHGHMGDMISEAEEESPGSWTYGNKSDLIARNAARRELEDTDALAAELRQALRKRRREKPPEFDGEISDEVPVPRKIKPLADDVSERPRLQLVSEADVLSPKVKLSVLGEDLGPDRDETVDRMVQAYGRPIRLPNIEGHLPEVVTMGSPGELPISEHMLHAMLANHHYRQAERAKATDPYRYSHEYAGDWHAYQHVLKNDKLRDAVKKGKKAFKNADVSSVLKPEQGGHDDHSLFHQVMAGYHAFKSGMAYNKGNHKKAKHHMMASKYHQREVEPTREVIVEATAPQLQPMYGLSQGLLRGHRLADMYKSFKNVAYPGAKVQVKSLTVHPQVNALDGPDRYGLHTFHVAMGLHHRDRANHYKNLGLKRNAQKLGLLKSRVKALGRDAMLSFLNGKSHKEYYRADEDYGKARQEAMKHYADKIDAHEKAAKHHSEMAGYYNLPSPHVLKAPHVHDDVRNLELPVKLSMEQDQVPPRTEICAEEVANLMAAHPGHIALGHTSEWVQGRWIHSDKFKLCRVPAKILGVSNVKPHGRCVTYGPVIVDANRNRCGKRVDGNPGCSDYLVLDGKHRMSNVDLDDSVLAYVGEEILHEIKALGAVEFA